MIVIVDYGVNNLASVRNAFRASGVDVTVSADPKVVRAADGLVLPGVGAAWTGMAALLSRGLDAPIQAVAEAGGPILGLCLGMQLLFERSEEGDAECLGLLPGTVRRLRGATKVPHIGWNQVSLRPSPLWQSLPPDPYMYFVHSYVCDPSDDRVVSGTTDYGEPFCSAVTHGHIWGVQFHPERSGLLGRGLIANFAHVCGNHGLGTSLPANSRGAPR